MLNCLDWETLAFRMESKILLMIFHTPANLNLTQCSLDAKFVPLCPLFFLLLCFVKAPSGICFYINSIIVKLNLMPYPLWGLFFFYLLLQMISLTNSFDDNYFLFCTLSNNMSSVEIAMSSMEWNNLHQ